MTQDRKISVVGLGYVGLPVAVAFGATQRVIGFDINEKRIKSLNQGHDVTQEITAEQLTQADVFFSHDPHDLKEADFHIIAVPTPVDEAHTPDLTALEAASKTVGSILKKGDFVVYESTVYPGATEEFCVPILEKASGLKRGEDFKVGYSPERINPGDRAHQFSDITKVVAGEDPKATALIAKVYGEVVQAGVHQAPSIKVAEAAKVIENTQRDLNIALMNELAIIFEKMGIDTASVLQAASTKWNFLPFKPGLVGGHCIGVDPYYLTFKAKQLGYRPEVILAGRRINDGMATYIVEQLVKKMIHQECKIKGARVGVLGVTFKEDCPDLRNSKAIDVIRGLKQYGIEVLVHDPIADPKDAKNYYDIALSDWETLKEMDAMVMCVPHHHYLEMPPQAFHEKMHGPRILYDVKAQLDQSAFKALDINLWRL